MDSYVYNDVWILLYFNVDSKILSSSGMSNADGISAGVLINFGAVIGTLLFGFSGCKI